MESDLDYARPTDRIVVGANKVYVRVHNRGAVPASGDVDLYLAPLAALTRPSTWRRLNAPGAIQAIDIPPRGWKLAGPLDWTVAAADPPSVLVALLSQIGIAPPLPTKPGPAGIDSVAAFWRFFRAEPGADKAALRAVSRA